MCFQIFLDKLAAEYPENFNVIQRDKGRFNLSCYLKIPENVLLIFQPPYSPELNPIERVWHYIKQELSWGIYDNLDALKEKVRTFIEELSTEKIASIAGWDYILSALATVG
jgi:transposase